MQMDDIVWYKGQLGVIVTFREDGRQVGVLPHGYLIPEEKLLLVRKHNHKVRFYGKWYRVVRREPVEGDVQLVLKSADGITREVRMGHPQFEPGWKKLRAVREG